jgi:hypothetical protein
MKGLQAGEFHFQAGQTLSNSVFPDVSIPILFFFSVLVFIVTHVAFCGKTGGEEMCFSRTKLMSLLTVCSGVFWYGRATQKSKVERLERTNPGYGHVHNSGALVVESDLSSFEP